MSREASSPELVKFRGVEQWAEIFLAIQPATVVYTARVNQSFSTTNKVSEFIYDTGSGTLANVLEGMTMWIGSSAGAYDKGVLRIRKAPTSTVFYHNETSEVAFLNNDFITIINCFGPWARHLRTPGGVAKMDLDLPFPTTAGGYAPPVPIMGPDAVVLRRTGSTVDFHPPSSAPSYSQISSIASKLHAAPGASATSGLTGNTPTLTYNADGCYRRDLTVTDANGRSTMGHRVVFVNPSSPSFILEKCSGDLDDGGWTFDVQCTSGVDISTVYDHAMVVLWGRERYGGVEGSIGPVSEHENIIAIGWIIGETIDWSPRRNRVTFTVAGPKHWIDLEDNYPTGLFDTDTPDDWTEFPTLTVDDILYHLLYWRTTLPLFTDCFLTGDTRRLRSINLPYGSIWEQIRFAAYDTIYAYPCFNNLGQLYIQIDVNLLPTADRSSIPVVQAITTADCIGEIGLKRLQLPVRNFVQLSGVKSFDGTVASPLFSRAPGDIPKRIGKPEAPGNHVFVDQDDCNRMSGGLLALENAPYELDVRLTNQRLFDVCPYQYATLTVGASDTVVGITMTDQKFVPRHIDIEHDPINGTLKTSLYAKSETVGVPGAIWVPPVGTITPYPPPPILPPPPIIPPPDVYPPPPVIGPPPPPGTGDCDSGSSNGPYALVWDVGTLDVVNGPLDANAQFPASLHWGLSNPTRVYINLSGVGNWATHIQLIAMYGGTEVTYGTLTGISGNTYEWTFFGADSGGESITGFKLRLDGNTDTDFAWVLGTPVAEYQEMGPMGDASRVPVEYVVPAGSLIVDNYYAVRIRGGDLDHYIETDTNLHIFPYDIYTCYSGLIGLTNSRTNMQFDLWNAGQYSGHMGSRLIFAGFGDNPCDEWNYWVTWPYSALYAYLSNLDTGINVPLSQDNLDDLAAINPIDMGNGKAMLVSTVFFKAHDNKIRLKASSIPYGPKDVGSIHYDIYNAGQTGERKVFIGDSYVLNVCGT